MTLAVHRAAVPSGAEGPERRGGPRQVQTDVPKWIYRCGDPTRVLKKIKGIAREWSLRIT